MRGPGCTRLWGHIDNPREGPPSPDCKACLCYHSGVSWGCSREKHPARKVGVDCRSQLGSESFRSKEVRLRVEDAAIKSTRSAKFSEDVLLAEVRQRRGGEYRGAAI